MDPFRIKYSAYASEQLAEARGRARAKPGGKADWFWSRLQACLREVVANEDHALGALTHLGYVDGVNLVGLRRAKAGHRIRLFFVASRERRLSIVLMLGLRKEGDKRDAYTEVIRRIERGEFDREFAEAGVAKPSLVSKK